MTIRAKATFKGQNGSCGYNTGKEYELKIVHKDNGRGMISISTGNKIESMCDYNSLSAFLKNWDNIKSL